MGLCASKKPISEPTNVARADPAAASHEPASVPVIDTSTPTPATLIAAVHEAHQPAETPTSSSASTSAKGDNTAADSAKAAATDADTTEAAPHQPQSLLTEENATFAPLAAAAAAALPAVNCNDATSSTLNSPSATTATAVATTTTTTMAALPSDSVNKAEPDSLAVAAALASTTATPAAALLNQSILSRAAMVAGTGAIDVPTGMLDALGRMSKLTALEALVATDNSSSGYKNNTTNIAGDDDDDDEEEDIEAKQRRAEEEAAELARSVIDTSAARKQKASIDSKLGEHSTEYLGETRAPVARNFASEEERVHAEANEQETAARLESLSFNFVFQKDNADDAYATNKNKEELSSSTANKNSSKEEAPFEFDWSKSVNSK